MVESISLTAEMIKKACDAMLADYDQRPSVQYDSAFAYAGRLGPGIQERRKDLDEQFLAGQEWSSAQLLRMEKLRSEAARDVTPKSRIDAQHKGE